MRIYYWPLQISCCGGRERTAIKENPPGLAFLPSFFYLNIFQVKEKLPSVQAIVQWSGVVPTDSPNLMYHDR